MQAWRHFTQGSWVILSAIGPNWCRIHQGPRATKPSVYPFLLRRFRKKIEEISEISRMSQVALHSLTTSSMPRLWCSQILCKTSASCGDGLDLWGSRAVLACLTSIYLDQMNCFLAHCFLCLSPYPLGQSPTLKVRNPAGLVMRGRDKRYCILACGFSRVLMVLTRPGSWAEASTLQLGPGCGWPHHATVEHKQIITESQLEVVWPGLPFQEVFAALGIQGKKTLLHESLFIILSSYIVKLCLGGLSCLMYGWPIVLGGDREGTWAHLYISLVSIKG